MVAVLSSHPRVAGVGLAPCVRGGVSSHIGRRTPSVPLVGMVPFHCR